VLRSGPVDARTQSALLAAIVCTSLALAMLLRQGRTRLWTAFAILNLALLAYQIGDFLYGIFGVTRPWPLRLTLGAAGTIASGDSATARVASAVAVEKRRRPSTRPADSP